MLCSEPGTGGADSHPVPRREEASGGKGRKVPNHPFQCGSGSLWGEHVQTPLQCQQRQGGEETPLDRTGHLGPAPAAPPGRSPQFPTTIGGAAPHPGGLRGRRGHSGSAQTGQSPRPHATPPRHTSATRFSLNLHGCHRNPPASPTLLPRLGRQRQCSQAALTHLVSGGRCKGLSHSSPVNTRPHHPTTSDSSLRRASTARHTHLCIPPAHPTSASHLQTHPRTPLPSSHQVPATQVRQRGTQMVGSGPHGGIRAGAEAVLPHQAWPEKQPWAPPWPWEASVQGPRHCAP